MGKVRVKVQETIVPKSKSPHCRGHLRMSVMVRISLGAGWDAGAGLLVCGLVRFLV